MTEIINLKNKSYTESLKNIKNQSDTLLLIMTGFKDKFSYQDNSLCDQIKNNFTKIQKEMRIKNFEIKVKESKVLKILTSIHSLRELEYSRYIVHQQPISWVMWDKFFDIIKKIHNDIDWTKYTDLDVVLSIFAWCSWQGPNYYNKYLRDEGEKEIPNIRPGSFGSIEFFITLDGYIKKSLRFPFELIEKILANTYGSISKKALNYVIENRIRILCHKYKYNYDFNHSNYLDDINGLKVERYSDFTKINYPENKKSKTKDWIEYGVEGGYQHSYGSISNKRSRSNSMYFENTSSTGY
jgi:hypothetical protein